MKNPKIQFLIGFLVSAFFLYITLRQVEIGKLWVAIKTFNWWWCIPFSIVNFASLYTRAIRWKYLLPPDRKYSVNRLFSPMLIGFGINNIIPLRAGEFARAYVLGKKEKMSVSSIFGTVVVERIFDSLSLLVLLFIVFNTVEFDPNLKIPAGDYVISGETLRMLSRRITWVLLLMVAGSFFLMWSRGRDLIEATIRRLPLLPQKFRTLAIEIIHSFAQGLMTLRDWKSVSLVMFLSLAVWILVGWSMQIGAYGFQGMHMTLMQGIAITVITCIAIILPATPGYWGLAEAGVVFGILVLNIDKSPERALGYALITHALQYFPVLFLGLFFLWREGISLHEITEHQKDRQPES